MEYPSFDMDVKFKDGSRGTQDFYFSDKDNLIEFSNGFNIEKDITGKWYLHFSRESKEMQDIAKSIALPHEINIDTNSVKIPLSKVSMADNGNIEFEMETTKDRRTGNARNFTITPNSLKTSNTEIPFERKGHTVGVTLPRNFPQLFLGNRQDSTIKNTLPVEFFNVLTDHKYKEFFQFDETNKLALQNSNIPHSETIDILNIDGNFYTLVNSKMMKIEAVSHVPQETSGYHDLTFVFKKGSEHIARTFKRVNTTKAENLATFMGISVEDWNTKNRHLGEDPVLTTAILTAKEFKMADSSRAQVLSSEGIEDVVEPALNDDKTDATPDNNQDGPSLEQTLDSTQAAAVIEEKDGEQDEPTPTAEQTSTEQDSTNEMATAVEEKDGEQTEEPQLDSAEQESENPEETGEQTDNKPAENQSIDAADEKEDEEKNKKEEKEKKPFKFSLAPLFYGVGLLVGVLAIMTGTIGLLALSALIMATPKTTEGIINDKKTLQYVESERMKKFKQKLHKTKEKVKDEINLKTNLIKSKDKNLKLAHKLLRAKAKHVEMTDEWNAATETAFKDKKITKEAKEALSQLNLPTDSEKLTKHDEKLSQIDDLLTGIQNDIDQPDGKLNDEQKQNLAPLVENARNNLNVAQNLNMELANDYYVGSALKNEADFSTINQQKMVAGLSELGLEPQDICGENGGTFGSETISNLNQTLDDKFQTYKNYLEKDGILDNNLQEIYATMDKFQTRTADSSPSLQP